jgi:methyl-accepting chemotaxis protein
MVHSFEDINESGQKVSNIMKDITSIVEQNNLIALNVDIEAEGEISRLVQESLDAINVGQMASGSAEQAFLDIIEHFGAFAKQVKMLEQLSLE